MAAEAAFRGFIETTLDALLIFEGCRRGFLPKITRRLQESEKRALVVSGAVFVFDEEETGIKRWTDGLSWSPSRTLGNFLIYRELDKKAASGNAGGSGSAAGTANEGNDDAVCDDALEDVKPNDMAAGPSSSSSRHPSASTSRRESLTDTTGATPPLDRARERALVGSLTSTYRFRSDGLVKKTISLSGLHMIGYYRIEDVTSGRLRTPSSHSELISLQVSSDFLSPTLFRVPPVVEVGVDGQLHYKGESDMPVSPLQRSLSSQDFPNQTIRSRPPSSESTGRAPSPRVPQMSLNHPNARDVPAATSPRRGSTSSFRAVGHRFEPYGIPRSSPTTANFPPGTGYDYSDAQHDPPSPPQGRFAVLPGVDGSYRSDHGANLSPSLDGMLSSSAPQEHWGQSTTAPAHPSEHLRRHNSDLYYQPRQAMPFSPGEPNGSANMFAYQPPGQSTSTLRNIASRSGRPPLDSASPSLAYQSYNAPLPPPESAGHFSAYGFERGQPQQALRARAYDPSYAQQSPQNHQVARFQSQAHQQPPPITYDAAPESRDGGLSPSLGSQPYHYRHSPQMQSPPIPQMPQSAYATYNAPAASLQQPSYGYSNGHSNGSSNRGPSYFNERQPTGLVVGISPDADSAQVTSRSPLPPPVPIMHSPSHPQGLGLGPRLEGLGGTARVASGGSDARRLSASAPGVEYSAHDDARFPPQREKDVGGTGEPEWWNQTVPPQNHVVMSSGPDAGGVGSGQALGWSSTVKSEYGAGTGRG